MQCVRLSQLLLGTEIDFISSRTVFNSFLASSISADSRSLKSDDIFIAIPGKRFDGHSYIADTLKKGASGIVFESGKIQLVKHYFKKSPSVIFVGVPDTRKLFGKIAKNYLALFDVKKIAITGSCGKTTVKGMIHSVLSQKYHIVSSPQSYNNDIGVPKTILSINDKTDILIQELGTNQPGEIEYLSNIVEQDCALITNIGPAHIEFFGSVEKIAYEKKAALYPLGSEGVAFLNAEDSYFDFFRDGLNAKVRSFGLKKGDLFPERILRVDIDRTEFLLAGEKITTRAIGVHGVLNATASALVGLHLGITMEEIKRGIESYTGESGRGNLYVKDGITLIDESYNANPLSVSASLDYMEKIKTSGRKIFVFGDMLELGKKSEHFHKEIAGGIIKSGIDSLYTYGKMAGITGETCSHAGFNTVFDFSDIKKLIDSLRQDMKSGNLILIKGSRAMKLERVIQGLFAL